ncbi:phage holin [Cytobacillus oceanisediminis]|uniref:phage holin n=1 Tax=Cytobacillus oceanisediminis TaxID=665099 RepID=UPI001C213411|nr:phage holin [Cytobacillus oceanisediminis]MBU8733426.1 phage holin [Cytobacillus oceanisediminis]
MINFKVRFKNPVFLAQFFLAFFAPILGYFGLTAQDLNTWGSVFNLLASAFSNPYVLFLIVVSMWNALNDPTTRGIKDSHQAKRYQWPK